MHNIIANTAIFFYIAIAPFQIVEKDPRFIPYSIRIPCRGPTPSMYPDRRAGAVTHASRRLF
jgi:hypothetical protein